jgi:DNA-binding CsgD family transcriptional regulator/tetratricopeptide (TPR) repeat protein
VLRGRRSERAALERVLAEVRAGGSAALVVRGEAGVGKTALLEYLVERAEGCRVARAAGVQSEMELAFAGIHQLSGPLLDRLDRLPGPQRNALAAAFGLGGSAPDRFLVGLALLGLLSEAAAEQPLVCVVDDAQWLDRASAQALGFVARRLLAEPVAVVIALRERDEQPQEWAGLAELSVGGLDDGDARALLASAVSGRLDDRVRDRIVAETRGNPLALLELPRGLTPAELAGGFGLPEALPLAGRIEESFARRLAALPADTRLLLLVAAVESLGDLVLVRRAAARLGIEVVAERSAAESGLCELGASVRFRHPLVRSAVYRAASPEERRRVHSALAEATDPDADPDRRAWHRARAAAGPDEEVAEELERSAGRAQARGGLAAAAAFLEQAAALTPEPARRAARALAAAEAQHLAGAPDAAQALLATAREGPLDELQRVRVDLVRAQLAFAVNRGRDAPPLLLEAARRLEPLDGRLARETYLDALSAAAFVGHLGGEVGTRTVALAARAAPAPPQPPRAADLLLDGLATVLADGYEAAVPLLQAALRAFRSQGISRDEEQRWAWLAGHAALDIWDDETWHAVAARHVEVAREAGALAVLPLALNTRVGVHLSAGEFDAAAALLQEVMAVAEATGTRLTPYISLAVAAFRGRETEAAELLEATLAEAVPRGEGLALTIGYWGTAVLYNGLGRYDDALAAAEVADGHDAALGFATRVLVEQIEAAVRGGRPERAAGALDRLAASTRPSGTAFARGTEARSRALLSEGEAAEALYREAIEQLGRTRISTAVARARLVYGEWLRREGRRADAREQLRTAHSMLVAMGMEGFADRAARELEAAGEAAEPRRAESGSVLTNQEGRVARLARDGLSNPEIGARLFISPRTVEYHLTKVFSKLGIGSRTELAVALAGDDV